MTHITYFQLYIALSMTMKVCRFGKAGRITQDLETLLGRKPFTMDQFIQDYKHLFNGNTLQINSGK